MLNLNTSLNQQLDASNNLVQGNEECKPLNTANEFGSRYLRVAAVKTEMSSNRAANNDAFIEATKGAPYGRLHGFHIIGRDTKVNGGISLGGSEREAIYVNDKENPILIMFFRDFYLKAFELENPSEEAILKAAYSHVLENIEYNLKANLRGKDRLVSLSYFVKNKVGICRHMSLLICYLIEKYQEIAPNSNLKGKVRQSRNSISGKGGHAWAEYESESLETTILDPAQKYFGSKKESEEKAAWIY